MKKTVQFPVVVSGMLAKETPAPVAYQPVLVEDPNDPVNSAKELAVLLPDVGGVSTFPTAFEARDAGVRYCLHNQDPLKKLFVMKIALTYIWAG